MLRWFGAITAVLALLCGFSAAPYTHAHHAIDSVRDGHHPHGDTLVHTHASPHSHRHADHPGQEPADREDGTDQIWSMNTFVFQPLATGHAPLPALVAFDELHVQLSILWRGAHRTRPTAHGPPIGLPPGLRAPPAVPPALA